MVTINRTVRNFRDLDLSFQSHPFTKDLIVKKDKEAIKNSIRQLILTKNYERPFHPEIGCQIYALLFENFDPIVKNAMEQSVRDVITKFEPRVRLIEVSVDENYEDNSIVVNVIFTYANYTEPLTVSTTITRTR